jgi:M6 family metalloprotease-like protein
MIKKFSFLLGLSILRFSQISFGVMHINGTDPGPKEYVRPAVKYSSEVLRKMGYNTENIKGVISPAIGNRNIAVILIEFQNPGTNSSGGNTLTQSDITGFNTTLNYLKNFYNEASYGKLKLNITYFYNGGTTTSLTGNETPYILNTPMSNYGADSESSLSQLIIDSLDMVTPASSLASTSIGGTFDAVMVAHAGYGNESTNNSGDIWSAQVGPFTNSLGIAVSQNGFSDGINIPARENNASPIGVTCHEFGHVLGLPDIYSTSGNTESKVGKWSLMDYGPWVNNGFNPTHPDPWCKKFLGWINPLTATINQSTSDMLTVQVSSTHVFQMPIQGNQLEYFLICYSSRSAYDQYTPGSGIMIWHIDEGIIDGLNLATRLQNNSINNYSHGTVDIVSADSTRPNVFPFGSPGELWPGTKKVFTTPDSDSYYSNTSTSVITLSNFIFSGNKAGFVYTKFAMSSVVNISKVINYPNPCGKGYFHPKNANGIITTFVFNLTKVSDDIAFTIYNIAGEKVVDVPANKLTFSLSPSQDYKIIYEYDWDGKNETGEDVAQGLYLYRFKSGKTIKTGKLAIVR